MQTVTIGDVTIDAVIEREGPWRKPDDFFPAFDQEVWDHYLPKMEPEVFDRHLGLMLITYQTFLIRTPHHNILVDTCTGENKGHPAPFDFPGKQRWKDELLSFGLTFEDIDYVFCTHLHVDHTGWNTSLLNGRWVPTFPNARYIFHRKEYEVWERDSKNEGTLTSRVFKDNCLPIVEAGQALLVEDEYCLDDMVSLLQSDCRIYLFCGGFIPLSIQTLNPRQTGCRVSIRRNHAGDETGWKSRYCYRRRFARGRHWQRPRSSASVGARRGSCGFAGCEQAMG